MNMLLKSAVLAVSVMSLTGVAHAATGSASANVRGEWPSFTRMDTNQDGYLDQQEASSSQEPKLQSADSDGDGRISRSEFETARALNSNPEDDLGMSGQPESSGRDAGSSQYPSSGSGSASESAVQ